MAGPRMADRAAISSSIPARVAKPAKLVVMAVFVPAASVAPRRSFAAMLAAMTDKCAVSSNA